MRPNVTERVRGGKKWKTVRLPSELASRVDREFTDPFLPFYAKVERLLDEHRSRVSDTETSAEPHEKHGIARVFDKIIPGGRSRRPGERRDGDPTVDDDRRLDEAEPQARLAEVAA